MEPACIQAHYRAQVSTFSDRKLVATALAIQPKAIKGGFASQDPAGTAALEVLLSDVSHQWVPYVKQQVVPEVAAQIFLVSVAVLLLLSFCLWYGQH